MDTSFLQPITAERAISQTSFFTFLLYAVYLGHGVYVSFVIGKVKV
jgi:hypothetical protein